MITSVGSHITCVTAPNGVIHVIPNRESENGRGHQNDSRGLAGVTFPEMLHLRLPADVHPRLSRGGDVLLGLCYERGS